MNCFKVYLILLSVVFSLPLVSHSQELPPVLTFSPKDYQADNQNWSITQGFNNYIYIANNIGLLEYDGEHWNQYPSPNQSILRSVFFHDQKIYTGSYREFGFWEKQQSGKLKYHSLSEDSIDFIGADEQFWNIEHLDNWIIFQSLDNIYTYHIKNKSLKKITIDGSITKIYKVGGDLYFQIVDKGLFKLEEGEPALVSDHDVFKNNAIINLYTYPTDVLVQTDTKGIYTLEKEPKKWPSSSNEIDDFTVYTSLQSKNDGIVLGTISEGVVFLNPNGTIQKQITEKETLFNNTVLSVFEDKDANVWLGLDNGINCVNVNSPISVFNDDNGVLGTIYASLVFEEKLFIGTNQGLFHRQLNNPKADFKFVEGSKGQVWTLREANGYLLCGHNNGSFIFSEDEFRQISDLLGTWCFKTIPEQPDLLLQGNYNGLSVLKKTNEGWVFRNRLDNFDLSSKFVEFSSSNEILIDHEYKGVYRLLVNSSFTEVDTVYQIKKLDKGLYSSLVKFKDTIYYAQKKGVWRFDSKQNEFLKDDFLSRLYSENVYTSGKLSTTSGEIGLWSFNKNSIDFTLQGKINNSFRLASIPITSDIRGAMVGYENINHIGDNRYLLGLTQGYVVIDYEKFLDSNINESLHLTSVKYWQTGKEASVLDLGTSHELKNKTNNIHFNFSVPYFEKYFISEYQYRLKGFIEEWSSWDEKHEVAYNNLPFGDYEFQVRARIGERYQTETKSYKFTINRPFVFSNIMLLVYLILLTLLFFIIHKVYQRYYKKQKLELQYQANREIELKQLESQQEIMQVKNDQLKQDIESKSRELAASTMSLIKKNEFLGIIKDQLQQSKPLSPNAKKVIKIIDKNINNTDDWKMFEEAFNNSDKDFLKTMKSKHPSLTPNDLRLCAYLRLNLSSKEIAPLFNISTKSVEVKRYRLRKKMDLPREIGLTDYILEI
ncbi:Y Y Y domain-containing protein [Psychroflexus sp. CAK57W]|uniref:helix-turn-helix and ligand-binding sensor domain-containing protein n=1 Tax=Psychroflexus curvus TaxID=2873595 RepID=UPI001CCC6D12|nr:triple tyrosine motif-containing protein [Psychroflexus curvus]MBZ9787252.1 Y Y Y domain-containing protein [Psychroflexus curvus]